MIVEAVVALGVNAACAAAAKLIGDYVYPKGFEDIVKLSVEEKNMLSRTAWYHMQMSAYDHDGSVLADVLILLDFQCLTAYRDWHIENGHFTEELADKVLKGVLSRRFKNLDVPEGGLPAFLWILWDSVMQEVRDYGKKTS